MNILHSVRHRVSDVVILKKIYLTILRFFPVHYSYELNRIFRSPYSQLEKENGIIFIHIPKAAGNALIKSLYGQSATGHDPLIRYKKANSDLYYKFVKFSVVRNPWDRMVSSFYYLKQGGIGFFDKDFRDEYLNGIDDFSEFIARMMADKKFEKDVMSWVHFVPQVKFLSLDGVKIDVDFWVKLEEMPEKFPSVCERLGVQSDGMIKDNSSSRSEYKVYYDDVSREYVGSLYRDDVDILGYEF